MTAEEVCRIFGPPSRRNDNQVGGTETIWQRDKAVLVAGLVNGRLAIAALQNETGSLATLGAVAASKRPPKRIYYTFKILFSQSL